MKCVRLLFFLLCMLAIATNSICSDKQIKFSRQAHLKAKMAIKKAYNKDKMLLVDTIQTSIDRDSAQEIVQDPQGVIEEHGEQEQEQQEQQEQQEEQESFVQQKQEENEEPRQTVHHGIHKKNPPAQHKTTYFLGNLGWDVLMLFRNLFYWDSFKVIMTTFPFYIAARMVDEKIQDCFFDYTLKKNKHCPPRWIRELARVSIGVPIGLLGSQAFLSHDDNMRITSQVFLMGMPFVLFAKNIIKKLDFDLCKRPWHEKFATEQRAHGGFPSGHMAEATFTAILYGKRFGPSFALPLGSIAVFVGGVFLACNRHYVSQLVAGASFGALFALAADKLADSKLAQKKDLGFTVAVNDAGGPALNFAMRF